MTTLLDQFVPEALPEGTILVLLASDRRPVLRGEADDAPGQERRETQSSRLRWQAIQELAELVVGVGQRMQVLMVAGEGQGHRAQRRTGMHPDPRSQL